MKKYLLLSAWVFSWLVLESRATEPRHAVLYYLNIEPISQNAARSLIAYVSPSGQALDWMFDSIIIFNYDLYVDEAPNLTDVNNYSNTLFGGSGLSTLAQTVAALRAELGDPAYRLHIYLTAPYTTDTDVNANIQNLIDQYNALDPPELELVGFYWGYEEGLSGTSVPAAVGRITSAVDFVHSRGYEMIWIPMNHDTYTDSWLANCSGCGFDRITLQVGFAYKNVGPEQFLTTDDRMHAHGLEGVELELGSVTNTTVTGDKVVNSANHYLDAADRYNWGENNFTTYYYASPISDHATISSRRPIYDRIYRNIAINPSHSVLPRVRVPAAGDSFTEQAPDRKNVVNGSRINLEAGTNGYPNANRTYLLFDNSDLLEGGTLLAAHVVLRLDYFPYGSKVNDGRLYRQYNPSWSESALNANNEPYELMTAVTPHRLHLGYTRFSFDITGDLASMRDSGTSGVSYMLKRDTEDGALAEASFRSREYSGGTHAPVIEYVYLPDAAAVCGNGVVETGETCDPPGSCPDCDDGDSCTADTRTGSAASCNLVCHHTPITSCTGGDDCCPSGCYPSVDSDCTATCGNGVVETGETCDPPGSCPTHCDDQDPCTLDTLSGSADQCTAVCVHTPVAGCPPEECDGGTCEPAAAAGSCGCGGTTGAGLAEGGLMVLLLVRLKRKRTARTR